MSDALMSECKSPKLREVAERAKRDPKHRFFSLAHLIDIAALQRSFASIRNDAAVGVDGVTKADYGRDLQVNLRDLHERLRSRRYRHQPIRQVHIPKEGGKTRPIGVSCVEDTVHAISDWCRRNRHQPVAVQHEALVRRVRGHFNYFGVNGNHASLARVLFWVRRLWFKWLNRRSDRASYTWKRYEDFLRDFPLPEPCIKVQIWAR